MDSWIYEEGEAAGRAEGKAAGRAEGKAEAIFKVMSLRKIKLSDAGKKIIVACTDLAQLDEWLERSLLASIEDELFKGIKKKAKKR